MLWAINVKEGPSVRNTAAEEFKLQYAIVSMFKFKLIKAESMRRQNQLSRKTAQSQIKITKNMIPL